MQFVVDASGVSKGFRDYKSAVDGIFSSLDKFEKKVATTMSNVEKAANSRSGVSAFKKSLEGLGNINIDASAAKKLSALSAAMAGFKAPSSAQAQNTRRFFTSLEKMPDLTDAFRSIKALGSLKASMEGFKAPPISQANNLKKFAEAVAQATPQLQKLNGIRGVSGVANELATISLAMRNLKAPSQRDVTNIGNLGMALRSLSGAQSGNVASLMSALAGVSNFRAPTPANVRNLVNFANALNTIKPPQNTAQIAAGMMQIAAAARAASGALGGFRGNLGGFNPAYGRFNAQTRQASINMMGLQNAFNGTFQVGSALRTMLGSLTIGELGRQFFEAVNAATQFRGMMMVLSDTAGFADTQLKYVNETAIKFGMNVKTAEIGFGKLSIAAHKSGLAVHQTREVFEGFSTAMTVLGTTSDRQNDVWLALQQVMNKGYLSAEELNQQLNEHLPGAMGYATEMAAKLGVSLEKGLKDKMLKAQDVATYFAKRMKEDFGPSLEVALATPGKQFEKLRGNFFMLMQAIGDAGASDGFTRLLTNINQSMSPENVKEFADVIGQRLASAADAASAAFSWLRENWDSIKGPLSTTLNLMGKWMVVSAALNIGRAIVTPLLTMRGALVSASAGLTQMTAASAGAGAGMARLTAGTMPLLGGLAALNIRAQASIVAMNGLRVAMNATRMAASGFAAIFGGPVGLALTVATVGVMGLMSAYMSMKGVTMQTTDVLAENARMLNYQASQAAISGAETGNVGAFAAGAAPKINAFAGEVGAAAQNLWNMAAAARAARLEDIKGQMKRNSDQYFAERKYDVRTRRDDLMAGFTGRNGRGFKSIGDFFERSGQKVSGSFETFWTNGQSDKDRTANLNRLHADQQRLKGLLKEEGSKPLESWAPQFKPGTNMSGATPTEPKSGGKTRKGARQPTFEETRNKLETEVDSLMDKLMESDPMGKLYADFVKTLTDEGHALLNDKGYKQFVANLKEDAKDGEVSVNSLIAAMSDSGNVNAKAMKDIEARYGKSSAYIIEMLKKQQAALEDAYKEAAIKKLDQDFKSLAKGMDAVGSSIPSIELLKSNIDDITALARFVMPGDEGFTKFITDLRTGAMDSATAIERLIAIMKDPALRSADASQFVKLSGVNPDDIGAGAIRKKNSNEYSAQQKAIDLEFGTRLLQQGREELALMQLTTTEAEIAKTVQDEVNRAKAAGIPLSQQMVDNLTAEVRQQKALADQMERNKTFYENNGIRSYIRDIKSAGEVANELDKNILQSLEDQLYNLGMTGKFSFNAIFDTIQSGIMRFAAQGVTEKFLNFLKPGASQQVANGQNPTLTGGFFSKLMGAKYEAAPLDRTGKDMMTPMYVHQVNAATGALSVGANPAWNPVTAQANMGGFWGGLRSGVGAVAGVASDGLGAVGGAALSIAKPIITTAANIAINTTGAVGGGLMDGFGVSGLDKGVGKPGMPNLLTTGVGTNPTNPLYVATNGAGGIAGGGTAGLFPVTGGVDPLAPLPAGTTSPTGGIPGGPGGTPADKAGAAVANSFQSNMAQMMPMVGMMFASQMKSPIAQIGVMFLSMMITQMMTAQAAGGAGGGGGGGIAGLVTKIGTALASKGAPTPGALEGGLTGVGGSGLVNSYNVSPAIFKNAPHYAEGTSNTSGGFPAILHDNEAVIPLSRGRKVPVQLTNGSSGANNRPVQVNFNVTSPDADSFRKSKQQIAADLHGSAARAYQRNN
jgi:tape measure domain-containing protein